MELKSEDKKRIIILGIFIVLVISIVVHYKLYNVSNVRAIVASYGKLAPVIFLALCIIRPVILLPVGLFSVLGGIMFGSFMGGVYTILGSTVGSIMAYYIARYLGRDFIENLMHDKMKKLDVKCREKGFLVTFLMRVIPILPCDVVSYICGLSNIKMFDFVMGTFIGIIPGTFIYSYFGSSLKNVYSKEFIISIVLLILLSLIPLIIKKFYKNEISEDIGLENEEGAKDENSDSNN